MSAHKKAKQPSPNIRVYGPLLERLSKRAEKDRRSINQTAILAIERGLAR